MGEVQDVKVTRFRRTAYGGGNSSNDEPRWHIAAFEIEGPSFHGQYKFITALCGYRIEWPGVRVGVDLTRAKRPPKGDQCKKCIKEREKRDA